MFTGIIEAKGEIVDIIQSGSNTDFVIASSISKEAYIDQSISHNGVCLTVVEFDDHTHRVTAIEETLKLTNLGNLRKGDMVNLERAMLANTRMDGHMVQGHVDTTTNCISVKTLDGSWYYEFAMRPDFMNLIVSKGSICISGVSLTVVEPDEQSFKVAIIPYTYEHTNFKELKKGDDINLEFDIIGKYVLQYMERTRG